MSVQYISDSEGKTTGVFIPIEEWEHLKKRYTELFQYNDQAPEWHEKVVSERLEEYRANPKLAMDFDTALKEIEDEVLKRRA